MTTATLGKSMTRPSDALDTPALLDMARQMMLIRAL